MFFSRTDDELEVLREDGTLKTEIRAIEVSPEMKKAMVHSIGSTKGIRAGGTSRNAVDEGKWIWLRMGDREGG